MNSSKPIEFKSKECNHNAHLNCEKEWEGLGFVFLCECNCHENKLEDASRIATIRTSTFDHNPGVKEGRDHK